MSNKSSKGVGIYRIYELVHGIITDYHTVLVSA